MAFHGEAVFPPNMHKHETSKEYTLVSATDRRDKRRAGGKVTKLRQIFTTVDVAWGGANTAKDRRRHVVPT